MPPECQICGFYMSSRRGLPGCPNCEKEERANIERGATAERDRILDILEGMRTRDCADSICLTARNATIVEVIEKIKERE